MEDFEEIYSDEKKELKKIRIENIVILLLIICSILLIQILILEEKYMVLILTILLCTIGCVKLSYNIDKENDILERILVNFLKSKYKEEPIETVQELHEIKKDVLVYKNDNGNRKPAIRPGDNLKCQIKINNKYKEIYVFSQKDIIYKGECSRKDEIDKTYIAITNINTNKNLYLESIERDYITRNKYIKYNKFERMFHDRTERIKDFYEGSNRQKSEKEYIELTEEDKEFFIKIYNKYNLLFNIILKDGKLIIVNRGKTKSIFDSIEYKIKYIYEVGEFLGEMIKEMEMHFGK